MAEKKLQQDPYPANSHKAREAGRVQNPGPTPDGKKPAEVEPTRPKVQKVISGTAVQTKPGMMAKFKELYMGDDARSVGQYLLQEVFVPYTKNLITDIVSQGVERMMYGTATPRSSRRGEKSYTSYSRISSGRDERREAPRELSRRERADHDFDNITLRTRDDAIQVFETLNDRIDQYDVATVADMLDAVDITPSFADNAWGWVEPMRPSVRRTRNGYMLELPPPVSVRG